MSRFELDYETPPPAKGRSTAPTKSSGGKWCGKYWQLNVITWVLVFGVLAFVGLEIAIVAKGDELQQTSRATVSMHDLTSKTASDVETYLKMIRAHFPANQETVTLEQVFDSIDKAHATMLWVNELKSGMSPEVIQQLVKNANTIVGNVSTVVSSVKSLFDNMGADTGERHRAIVNNAALFFAKGAELLSTVSPGEFHAAFSATQEAVQTMAKLSHNVSQDRVNKIVESASDILGAVESEHIIATIGHLVKGATEVIERFTRPGGIRLSLPLEGEASGRK